jgi:hypothetical protein
LRRRDSGRRRALQRLRQAAAVPEAADAESAGTVGPMSSIAATAPTATRVALAELVALFLGDEDSRGFPHLNLVLEACERLRPRSSAVILELLYPLTGEAPDELTDRIVRWGYELWLQRVYDRDPVEWQLLAQRSAA